ncbi:MAG: peroxiredoxin family protein [Limisphaerales bacterium]
MKTRNALLALCALSSLIASAQTPPQPSANRAEPIPLLEVGALAPDFVSKDLAGKEVRLSDSRNKIVVLDFWATWCGPCKASLPHTAEIAKRYKDQGVVVLANCTSDTRANFDEFVQANREKYSAIEFVCDPHDRGSASFDERASRKLYGVKGIPTQFVIGRDGKIAAVIVGYGEGDHQLEDALTKLGLTTPAS